ncbi:hypothetical protein EYR40_006596 [Pleurotus pulmonarius]|nr:hypothetical protein EYR36_011217 [Pleurotus pulmonarius]KAF4599502.1 hypothetical protein EYR40_006596 [Pleurotus pulmonarius]
MDDNHLQLNSEIAQHMRALNISPESLQSSLENPGDDTYYTALKHLLEYTVQHQLVVAHDIYPYIVTFVQKKDTGFNTLFLDAARNGNWSALLSHHLPIPLRSVVAEARRELPVKFERYRLGEDPSQSAARPAPLWLTVTFVRHAESEANTGKYSETDPHLTHNGMKAALALGNKWRQTRIDEVYTSGTQRSDDTGVLICSREGVQKNAKAIFVEHDFGEEYNRLLRSGDYSGASLLRTGGSRYGRSVEVKRPYRTQDGESQNDVAHRAQLALLHLIFDHGVALPAEPLQASPNHRPVWDGSLIDGVPHIVVVSHNLFLCELVESMACWEALVHREGDTHYDNAEWSRHLLRLDWPEGGDCEDTSYRRFWLGLRLDHWTSRN